MDGEQDPFPDDETGLLESLRRLDNWAEEINNTQQEVVDLLQDQTQATGRLIEELTGDSLPGIKEDPSTYLFNMSAQVPPSTSQNDPLKETREMEYDGAITQIFVVSTSAAQQAVGVRFGFESGERILPRDDPSDARYVPLGGQPVENEPNVSVSAGDKLTFSFANNDPQEGHFVTALLQVQESL